MTEFKPAENILPFIRQESGDLGHVSKNVISDFTETFSF